MQVLLGFRDFGKIKSAEVDIGGFSVFVGNNNSGKTYVMQLIYGIWRNLAKYLNDEDLYRKYFVQMEEQAASGKIILDAGWIETLEKFYNELLQKYKEQIVLDTFYEKMEIGQIYVRFLMEENERFELFFLYGNSRGEKWEAVLEQLAEFERMGVIQRKEHLRALQIDETRFAMLGFHIANEKKRLVRSYINFPTEFMQPMLIRISADLLLDLSFESLFLPASRTGLFMLYKEFFVSKADEAVKLFRLEESSSDDMESRKMNITQPVYDFLRFVQTFSPKRKDLQNEDLIQFVEEHLIEGRIMIDQRNQPVYQTQGVHRGIPLYLSSSMVNELMPILYVLQNVQQPRRLIWDEIETSLHPQKQMELARLLSRMCNAGFSMIVSTHSDTMAAKINNLCLLSFSQVLNGKRAEILKKAGLEEADLFKERIHVYQFENDDSGRSLVRELEYDEVTGYQFSQFQDSLEKLFQETRLILE